MKRIPLINGKFTLVSDRDFSKLSKFRWRIDSNGYVVGWVDGKPRFMSRVIKNFPQGKIVDHKNRNPLDNRRSNLRVCSRSDNAANSRLRKWPSRSSKYKGVVKAGSTWRARIRKDYRLIDLGRFRTQEEAARAYNTAAKKLFGRFAACNPV